MKNFKHCSESLQKITFLLIVSCISIFSFWGCNNNEDIDYSLSIPNEFNVVGKMHNEGIESIYQLIKSEQIAAAQVDSSSTLKSNRSIDFSALIKKGTLAYCQNKQALKSNYAICLHVYDNMMKTPSVSGLKSINLSGLNSTQKTYLSQISDLLGQKYSKDEIYKLKDSLDEINLSAKNSLSDDEAAIIYCATSTAFSSYQYWQRNYRKWYFAIHYPEILSQYNDSELAKLQVKNGSLLLKSGSADSFSWFDSVEDFWNSSTDAVGDWWAEDGKDIANSDVEGAVSGAIGGAVVGASAGGVGAAPGAVSGAVAGGVASSAGTAVISLWD